MIYFVLPVYNEEKNLPVLIGKLRQRMSGRDYRIVAVNDGSMDNSLDILKGFGGPDLIIGGSVINMNVGAVFSDGIGIVLAQARDDDVLVIMESDQTSDVEFVDRLVAGIDRDGNDVVIASRYPKGGGYAHFPLSRRVFSYCANYLMRMCFPIQEVCDYTIFFRAYRVGVLRRLVAYFGKYGLIQSKGFVANAELLIKLSLLTERIKEIPYVYDYQKKLGKSKINIVRTINEYIVLINYMRRIFGKVDKYKRSHNIPGILP